MDLGSGGVMLLPPQQAAMPRLTVAAGKDRRMFVHNAIPWAASAPELPTPVTP
jgi:hypothetical protein